jgi:hypothetical protein|tara:strand:- start:4834 stop:5514 length:681 start_codon:yes stop_codon:yes gene_type:complete
MPSLAEFAKGFNAAGYSSNSSTRSPKISDSISKYFDSVSYSGKQNINPVPKSGLNLRSFQDTGFVGFTGISGGENLKQFSFGNLGTKFIDKDEAQSIGAVSDRGQSLIKTDFGKQVFNEFKTVIAQNQVQLGKSQIDASEALADQAATTTAGLATLSQFVQDVQSQLGAVDKRLSDQVIQIGKDTTQLGKSNGDGGGWLDNLASGLGIGLPVLAIGGIAALLLLRK